MNSEILFVLKNISVRRKALSILKNVSLTVNNQEFLAILGPSGAGKSTLLRLLNGLDSPTSGSVTYAAQPFQNHNIVKLREEIGIVFQNPVMVFGSVRENLKLSERWKKHTEPIHDDKLVEALQSVDLSPNLLDKDARSLSGGEKQRIALARVLLNEPRVLLLDELTANLDPNLARYIMQTIYHLYEKLNLTIIIVSHDHKLVQQFISRVAFLIEGKLVEEGSPELLIKSNTPQVQNFLTGTPK
ncbi:ATP-binding cassette domain-containing protein [Candidatus Neomarinimicrobiota bacterium]